MSAFSRYRGTQRLASSEASRLVLQILRETPETRAHDRDSLVALVAGIASSGVADTAPGDPAGDGYRQVMALLAGVLLKLAGASDHAIAGTLRERSAPGLEALVEAIVGRMAQLAEQGEPVRRLAPASGSELAPSTDNEGLGSVVGLDMSAVGSPDAGSNPALDYLSERVDEGLRRVVRNLSRPAVVEAANAATEPILLVRQAEIRADPPSMLDSMTAPRGPRPTPADSPAVERGGRVEVEVAKGVTVTVDAGRLDRYREPSQRAELIRAFAAAIEGLLK